MQFVYPGRPYQSRTAGLLWAPEYEWAQAQGLATGLGGMDNNWVWVPSLVASPSVGARPRQVLYWG